MQMSEANLPRRQLAKITRSGGNGDFIQSRRARRDGGGASADDQTTAAAAGRHSGPHQPLSCHADAMDFQLVQQAMQALGFKVKNGNFIANRRGHLAGTDAERAADLNAMFADPEIKAVICLRGGSGAARILPLLDYALIAANPKPLLAIRTSQRCTVRYRRNRPD